MFTALTEIRTRVTGFKVQCDDHYTIRANINHHWYKQDELLLGFEPKTLTLLMLRSNQLSYKSIFIFYFFMITWFSYVFYGFLIFLRIWIRIYVYLCGILDEVALKVLLKIEVSDLIFLGVQKLLSLASGWMILRFSFFCRLLSTTYLWIPLLTSVLAIRVPFGLPKKLQDHH